MSNRFHNACLFVIPLGFGLALVGTTVWAALSQPVGGDFVAYALPSANWVRSGTLALPQLGSQYDLDKYWRFNAPLLGVGPAAPFYIFGVNHAAYLVGLLLLTACTLIGILSLCRKAIGNSAAMWFPTATGILLIRSCHSVELVNQRYSILAPLAIGLVFFPTRREQLMGHPSGAKWLLAAVLPLVHPALLPASIVWVGFEFGVCIRSRYYPQRGSIAFALGVGACACWYVLPPGFTVQFLPHLYSREFVPFSGWDQAASWKYALPSQLTQATILICAVLMAPRTLSDSRHFRVTVCLAIAVLLDASGRMLYLGYYVVGLAPTVLLSLHDWNRRRHILAWLSCLAVANVAVFAKLAVGLPRLPTSESAKLRFVLDNTRIGDQICLGPPFVLLASEQSLEGDRSVPFVLPTALYLRNFDEWELLSAIRSRCDCYVGDPVIYRAVQRFYKLESPPVFQSADIAVLEFEGQQILIARVKR